LVNNEIVQNPYVWMALGLSVGLLLLAVYLPFLADLLKLSNPGIKGWLLVLIASSMTCVVGQLVRRFLKK
jgi:Ca2+-transporting ATPase